CTPQKGATRGPVGYPKSATEPVGCPKSPTEPVGCPKSPAEPVGCPKSPTEPVGCPKSPAEPVGCPKSPTEPVGCPKTPAEPVGCPKSPTEPVGCSQGALGRPQHQEALSMRGTFHCLPKGQFWQVPHRSVFLPLSFPFWFGFVFFVFPLQHHLQTQQSATERETTRCSSEPCAHRD
uniref:Uncharacterized protein n=1 Tax=Geospiza parvula TaxID=87175 RepID=A0A8U8C9Q7_GEOPR